jgi:hypothetical protein
MKRIQIFGFLLLLVFGISPVAAERKLSWFSLRVSQSTWEPAAFNEIDKLRQINLQSSAIFGGGLLATPADYFSYGTNRQSMPFAELILSIGGEFNRGNLVLGYGATSPSGLNNTGLSYTDSQTFNIVSRVTSNQYNIFQSSDLKHYTLGYDHELYPFRGEKGLLKDLGFILGIQFARDEFEGSTFNTGQAQTDSGTSGSITSSSVSSLSSFGTTEHNITTGDVQFGLIYRMDLAENLELEAGAKFGMGIGQSNAIIKTQSLVTLGSSTFPLESNSEYSSDGDLRTSRLHLGVAYRFTEVLTINTYYSVTNRYYTPTSGSVKAGGLISIESQATGPFYTQKDKMSNIGIEFQARFN